MARSLLPARASAHSPAPARRRLRRLVTAGLALAAAVAGPLAAAPATAVVSPSASCADVAAATPGAPDGTYTITVLGQTLDVWCAGMAGTPAEYLSLGPGNVSVNGAGGDVWGTDVRTTYQRVRLLLPTSVGQPFSVLRTDRTFSTSTGFQGRAGGTADWTPFAGGGNCGGNAGTADVDLAGTPFEVRASGFAFYGWDASGYVSQLTPQRVTMASWGWCSSVGPVDPTPGLPWENGHPDTFPLVWAAAVAPVVTAPSDVTVASGARASFTSSATGDPALAVQWQTSPDGTTWTDVAGATSGTLDLAGVTTADSGLRVRAVWSNAEGTVASAPAALTVLPALPVVTTDPQDVTLVVGGDATFDVAATGDPAPALQWQSSDDAGTTWQDLAGETGTTLVLADVPLEADGTLVRAVATNAAGAVASADALLTVSAVAPTLTASPTSTTVTAGGSATFTVAVAGTPAPTIQWQVRSADGLTWADLAGEDGATLTLAGVTAAQDGTVYRAYVANAGGAVATDPVTLTVVTPAVAPVVAPTAPVAAPVVAAAAALAVTGSTPAPWLALALALVAAGTTAVVATRRATA
ncbi:immunoglobulin domain-containing protein [Actinotalea solisilvae]|uniref:immunoglobulin domain-containing protein n=1 Tax=Actinotalea solisilvae TaxID=2072922 RepID=UPI0018F1B46D|nr:immunoglobulin domain-containing protein [Actinotalea solisilvae]